MRSRFLLVLVLVPALTGPAAAGIIFNKKGSKPSPSERVPELLNVIKGDGDENKRVAAAEELRQYDATQFPDIVPVLTDVLANDKKPAVRSEAAQTLGKLRPVSQQAGQALEQALAKDSSMRVRLHARSALLGYHWHNYRPTHKDEAPPQPRQAKLPPQSKEPPLATFAPPRVAVESTEPPLATPAPAPEAIPTPVAPTAPTVPASTPATNPAPQSPSSRTGGGPRPLPQGPPAAPADGNRGTAVPSVDSKTAPASGSTPPEAKGPDLGSDG